VKEHGRRCGALFFSIPGLSLQDVLLYGSTASGFGENADVDATAIAPGLKAVAVLRVLAVALPGADFELVEEVYNARVPILRLRTVDGIDVDLSVNNWLPVYNTRLLKAYGELDPRVVDLVKEVKRWAKSVGVVGAQAGHLSAYGLTLLAIYYAQIRGALPVLQGDHVPPIFYQGCNVAFGVPLDWRDGGAVELSFADFVGFYATEYSWGRECVSVRTGTRREMDSYPLLNAIPAPRGASFDWEQSIRIEDPMETTRDLADVLFFGRSAELRTALNAQVSAPIPPPPPLPPVSAAHTTQAVQETQLPVSTVFESSDGPNVMMADFLNNYQEFALRPATAPPLSMMDTQQRIDETMQGGSVPDDFAMQRELFYAGQPTDSTRTRKEAMRDDDFEKRHCSSGGSSKTMVFVHGLNLGATAENLRAHFGQFGIVVYSEVFSDEKSGLSRGCGRVKFQGEIPEGVLDRKHLIEGRFCRVHRHDAKKTQRKTRSGNFSDTLPHGKQAAGPPVATETLRAQRQLAVQPVVQSKKAEQQPARQPLPAQTLSRAAIAAAAVADLEKDQRRFDKQFVLRLNAMADQLGDGNAGGNDL
jgi:hypothetical protein